MAKKKPKKKLAGLIQNYGVYWTKSEGMLVTEETFWGNVNRVQSKKDDVNFWKQAGVYVLYNALFEPIYSGQSLKLGSRIRQHSTNIWLGKKWKYFSWFGLGKLNRKGNKLLALNANQGASTEIVLDTLEAVLIASGARTENKQGPVLHSAILFHQRLPKKSDGGASIARRRSRRKP